MALPDVFDLDSMAAEVLSDMNGTSEPAAPAAAEGPTVVDGLVMPPAEPKNTTFAPTTSTKPAAAEPQTADSLVDGEPDEEIVEEPAEPAADPAADEKKLPVPDPKFPNVQFELKDAEGADLSPPDGMTFTFKADGGRVFENIPLPHVIQLAQRGVYNQRIHDEVQQFRGAVPEIQQTLAEYEATIAALTAHNERLLGDDEYLFDQRDALQKASTPEARADRAERALREREAAEAGQSTQSAIVRHIDSEITPQFEKLLATHGEQVSWEEIWGKYDQMLMPFKRNGVIPPDRLGVMEQILTNELVPWVESTAANRQQRAKENTASRASDAARILAAEGAAKRKAAEAATLQRRQFVRRSTVTPAAGSAGTLAPRQQAPVDMSNVLDSIMDDAQNYGR